LFAGLGEVGHERLMARVVGYSSIWVETFQSMSKTGEPPAPRGEGIENAWRCLDRRHRA
jgi:hypothetical protein